MLLILISTYIATLSHYFNLNTINTLTTNSSLASTTIILDNTISSSATITFSTMISLTAIAFTSENTTIATDTPGIITTFANNNTAIIVF